MPTFTIETPGGRKLTIDAADEAQAMAGAQQWHAEQQKPSLMDTGADVAKSAGVGLGKAAIGIAGLPGDVQSLALMGLDKATGAKPANPASEAAGVAPRMPGSADIQGAVERWTGPFYEPQTAAGTGAKALGEFAPGALVPGGIPARVAGVAAPALGATIGEKATGSPYGRVAGALAGGVTGARAITPFPATAERARLAEVLTAEGVPLTAGQRTGNKPLQWFEAAAADTPLAAGRAARMNEAQGRAFSGAVMRRIGASGDEIATPDAVNTAVKTLGTKFDNLAARNTLTADPQLGTDLRATRDNYLNSVIPSQRVQGKQNVDGIIADVVAEIQSNGGKMAGTLYQDTRSRLGKMAEGVRESDPQLSTAIKGIQRSLDDAMTRSISPADQAAWAEANVQYRNWKALEKAMSGAGSSVAEGFVSPSQLRGAVAGQNRGAYARGQGDMNELAHAGEALLRPLPQSGTAPRQAAANLFTSMAGGVLGQQTGMGMEGILAGMAAPALAGRATLSTPVQGYLGNQLMPMTRQEMNRRLVVQELLARPQEQGQQPGR